MTREFTRLTQRFGGVLAVAAVVAFVGGTVSIAANDKDGKDSKKEDKRKDDDYKERYKTKVWRKIWMCQVEKGGKAHLIELSEKALGSPGGDGSGEQVARHRHHRWTRDCREAPEPPAPPPPPLHRRPTRRSRACWNGMKRSALAGLLGPDSSPATSAW